MGVNNFCIDCAKQVKKGSIRCKSCDIKRRKENKKEYFCLDCGKKIWRGSLRCKSCAHKKMGHTTKSRKKLSFLRKGNKNPFYGKKHSIKIIKRLKKANSGKNHPQWKGGIFVKKSGYIYIHTSKHPFSTKGGYVLQHRLVMEKKLVRFLKKKEVVHHIDGDPQNNDLKNLWLFPNNSEHMKVEQSLQRLASSLIKKNLIYFDKLK